MVTCGICLEQTKEIGELECCDHRFCWPCITQWSDRETRCPLCKQRFKTIKRKALYIEDSNTCAPNKRRKLNATASSPASATHTADADADAAAPCSHDSTCCPDSPKGCLEGVVLETKRVALRDQVYVYNEHDEQYANFLQSLHCVVCGGDENEEHLLICDGCDQGYHTYCVNRRTVPLGDWFCQGCTQQRRQQQQAATQRQTTRRPHTGRQQGPGQRPSRRSRTAAATPGDTSHSEIDLVQSDLDESENTEVSSEEAERTARSAEDVVASGPTGLGDEALWLDDLLADDVFTNDSDSVESSGAAAAARAGGGEDVDSRRLMRRAARQGLQEAGDSIRGVNTGGRTRSSSRHAPAASNASSSGRRAAASARAVSGQGSRHRQQESHQAAGSRLPVGRVRLRTWQQLREENEPAARAQPVVCVTDRAAAAADVTAAVAVDQRTPSRAPAAAAGQRAGAGVHMSQEEAAWADFEHLRHEQQVHGARPASGAAAASSGRSRAREGTSAGGAAAGKITGSDNYRRLRRAQQPSPTGGQQLNASGSAYFTHDSTSDGQAQVRLRAALMARLQRQQQQAGGLEWSASNPPDVKEPGYMDSIRDDLAAARVRGEQMRRRRLQGALGAPQVAPIGAGGGVQRSPGGSSPSRQSSRAATHSGGGGGGSRSPGASQQRVRTAAAAAAAHVSSLGVEAAAARREDTLQRERARRQRNLQHTWQQSSRGMMGRWLSSAAEQSSTGPHGLQLQNRTSLPHSARTVGAVRRGAAVAAGAGSGGAVLAAAAGVAVGSAAQPSQLQQQHRVNVVKPGAYTSARHPQLETGTHRIPVARWRAKAAHNGPLVTSSYFPAAAQGAIGTCTAAPPAAGSHDHPHDQQQQLPHTPHRAAADEHTSEQQLEEGEVAPSTISCAAPADGVKQQKQQKPLNVVQHAVGARSLGCDADAAGCSGHPQGWQCPGDHKASTLGYAGGTQRASPQQQQHIQWHLTQQQQQQYNGSNSWFARQQSVTHSSCAQQSTGVSDGGRAVPGKASPPQSPPHPTTSLTVPDEAASPPSGVLLAAEAAATATSPCEAAAAAALLLPVKDSNTAGLSRDELKQAKMTAQALAKARLASPYRRHLISKEVYTAAAKAATHGLYEQVKAGELQLQDLAAAAAVAASAVASTKETASGADADASMQDSAATLAAAQVIHVTDLMLAEEGVVRS